MTGEEAKKWNLQCTAREIVEILKNRQYGAVYAENLEQAKKTVLSLIPKGSSIAVGGSETLGKMGMADSFRSGDYRFFDRYQNIPAPERVEIMRQSIIADYLVTGVNAITRGGELVCMDCLGNRAAGMIFGPKHVIVVAGANKVVDTLSDAMRRIRSIAPLNVKRLGHDAPCAQTGVCSDCAAPERMCNSISIVKHGGKFKGRFTVIVVAEEAGY